MIRIIVIVKADQQPSAELVLRQLLLFRQLLLHLFSIYFLFSCPPFKQVHRSPSLRLHNSSPSSPSRHSPSKTSNVAQRSTLMPLVGCRSTRAHTFPPLTPANHRKHPRPPLPPPHVLSALVSNSPAFNELMKIEQKLDWTLMRKKAEVNDALGRPTRVSWCFITRTLGALNLI